jgi:hypothetical protein
MNKFLKEMINPLTGLGQTKKILGNIGDNLSATLSLLSKPKKSAVDQTSIDQVELKTRYKNARLTAFVLLAMFGWAFVNMLITQTTQGFVLSILGTIGVGLYYFAICRALFKARLALASWADQGKLSVTWIDYFNAIAENPKNAFPRNIK